MGLDPARTYLPELESLRGLAMLLVLTFHVNGFVVFTNLPTRKPFETGLLNSVRFAGDSGVSLFFVLSGFLLSLPFLGEYDGGRRVDRRRFATRRILRIMPLYWAVLLVALAFRVDSLAELPSYWPFLVFPDGFRPLNVKMEPFSNVWWSLHTEMQFYLLLPLLGLALRSARARLLGMLGLAAYAVAFACYEAGAFVSGSIPVDLAVATSVFGRGPLFLWGILAAAIYRWRGPRLRAWFSSRSWIRLGGGDLLLVLTGVGVLLLMQWRLAVGLQASRVPPYHAHHLLDGLLWAAVILIVLLSPLRLKTLVHNRWLEKSGVLSYSMYMLHVPIVLTGFTLLRRSGTTDLLGWNVKSATVAVALVALCYCVSRLTYRYIELPFLQRKENV